MMSTDLDLSEARRIASEWHSGQWSALYAFASSGTIQRDLEGEVETIVRECEHRVADPRYASNLNGAGPQEMLEEARALLEFVTQPIVSVWSAYGHEFLHEDGYGSCIRCGAEFELIRDDPEDPAHGAYVAPNGDEATRCAGTRHGEEGDPDCNCCYCTG
jgi:hypothetical protein